MKARQPPLAPDAPSEQDALRRRVEIRADPAKWFLLYGHIKSKAAGQTGHFASEPPLRLNEFQREVVAIYRYCMEHKIPCRICIVKPRQRGSSTICQAIFYTHLRNFAGNGMLLANDFDTTEEVHQMWTMFCDHDAFGGWGSRPVETKRGFTNGSLLKLRTANSPNAGIGGTWHAVHSSETALYKTDGVAAGEFVFASIKGGLHDLPNTLLLQESTARGAMGIHYETYQSAVSFADYKAGKIPKDWNGFFKVFYPWFAFADCSLPVSEAEAADIMASLEPDEQDLVRRFDARYKVDAGKIKWWREKLKQDPYKGNHALFERDYPRDDVSCFLTTGNFRFDPDALTDMDNAASGAPPPRYCTLDDGREDILRPANLGRPPVITDVREAEAWLRVWETPVPGRRYLLSADFMTGEQAAGSTEPDCHAFGVWRDAFEDEHGFHVPKLVAACQPDCRVDTDVCCRWIGLLSRMYKCIVVPEINNSNGLVDLLRREACVSIYHRLVAAELKSAGTGQTLRKPGFNTTTSSKPLMIDGLAARIRERGWSVPCPRARAENRTYLTKPDGSTAAAPRKHDDWCMMQAIAGSTLPSATIYAERTDTTGPRTQGGGDGF